MAGLAGTACGIVLTGIVCFAASPTGAVPQRYRVISTELKSAREPPRELFSEPPPRVLLGTMTFPEDNIPLDVTVAHQVRMISIFPQNVEVVIIDNRPPWMAQTSIQEDILLRMQESGVAKVHKVDYKLYDDPAYLQRFIVTGDDSNSTRTLEGAHDRSDISGQHMSSNSMGMFEFLERCRQADDTVGLCIFLDPDIIVYRSEAMGMAELAHRIFAGKKGQSIVALNPPTMCSWANHSNDPDPIEQCTTYKPGLFSQRYMILNRTRLVKALPLRVPHENFNVNFEHLFSEGLRLKSYHAGQRMKCGHTFAIHPFSKRWAHCRNKRENLHIVRHSLEAASHTQFANRSDLVAPGFDAKMVTGLQEIIRRVEAGKLPSPESQSITNGCEDMCPSRERIAEGVAW